MKYDFQNVKRLFSGLQCKAAPDFSENALPFILIFDFSKVAISAVLSPEQNSKERFLGVKSRKGIVYKANYHSSKGELLALTYGLQKLSHLLCFKKFVVVTDSKTVLH